MNGMLRKELRELRPFALLGVFLLALDVLEWFTQQLDMQPLKVNIGETGDSNEALAVLLFLIAFAAGTGLVVREMNDRTLAFLDGLPITRARIFGTKVGAAFIVLLLYPVAHMLMITIQHFISRQSLDHSLHAALLWQATAMSALITASGLALGLLLGYLRALCWLTLGVIGLMLFTLIHFVPGLSVLNPIELLEMRLVGFHWRIPPALLFTQLGLIVGSGLLAMGLFVRADGSAVQSLQQRLGRPLASAAVTLATIAVCLAAVIVIGLLAADGGRSGTEKGNTAKFAEAPAATMRTQRYSFSYGSQQSERAQVVLREADRIHDEVAVLLGAPAGPRIDVDLTGSLANTEGTAFHDRIRMHVGRDPLKVLAHETAHVLAHRLAGGERDREFSRMSVLNEGLANWVHNQVTGAGSLTDMEKFQAAVVSRRQLVKPEQLTDIDALARSSDINLRYPLGAALVEALVARHGKDAPHKLLVALASPDFPRGLAGSELWFAAFQAAGFDLGTTFDDYSRQLQRWEVEYADRIAALPRPRVTLVYRKGDVGVDMRWEGEVPSGWSAVLRTRPKPDSPLEQYMQINLLSPTGSHALMWISRARMVNDQICFQSGLHAEESGIFEPWSCAPLEPDPR